MTSSNRLTKDVLWALALFGLVGAVLRLCFGLGATTNLTDAVPWGLWKVLNMIAGVALATSGFTVGFLVYVLRRERFRPLVRPAILVAFLGYGSSCLALLFDIGLPHRFWHPFVMWNHHSFLFEVFWCVILYFTVTAIELAPTILERFRAEKAARWLHRIAFGVVVTGISLSSLHHSSLGSLFLVSPLRLHGLWYTTLLPVFFIVSAMGCGMMCLILLRLLHARWYDPAAVYGAGRGDLACGCAPGTAGAAACGPAGAASAGDRPEGRDLPMLRGLAVIAAWILGVYLVLKFADLLRTGAWELLLAGTWESWLYLLELTLTAILPVLLVALPRGRRSPVGLGVAAAAATAGLALNRLDVGIFGYWRDAQTAYLPSLTEWAVGLGVVAAAGLVFLALTEHFPIFSARPPAAVPRRFQASFDAFTRVWNTALSSGLHRATVIAVIVLPLGWVLMYPPYRAPRAEPVAPAVGLDVTRATLRLDGDRSGVEAVFAHAEHQQRLGGEASCAVCHHVSLPGDRSTACSRCHRAMLAPTDIFDHEAHMHAVARREGLGGLYPANRSCAHCHAPGQPETAATARPCQECHEKDMWLTGEPDPTLALAAASSFLDAMHGACLECHRREAPRVARPGLAECGTCHPRLRPRQTRLAAR